MRLAKPWRRCRRAINTPGRRAQALPPYLLSPPSPSPLEPRHDLGMGGVAELVDRRDVREAIAAVDEDASVAREGRSVAGHGNDIGHGALGEFARLRLGALTRRIEDDGVHAKLARHERPAKQV